MDAYYYFENESVVFANSRGQLMIMDSTGMTQETIDKILRDWEEEPDPNFIPDADEFDED